MRKKIRCKGCSGLGVQYSEKEGVRVRCPICHGTGEMEVEDDSGRYY